eukprot:3189195-Rhodomonas_salina.4
MQFSTCFSPAEKARAMAALESTIAKFLPNSTLNEEVASGRDRPGQLYDNPPIRKPDGRELAEVKKLLHRCHSESPEPKPETLRIFRLPASSSYPTRRALPTQMASTCTQRANMGTRGGEEGSFARGGTEAAGLLARASSMPEIEATSGSMLLSNVEAARIKHAVRALSCE